MDSRSCGHRSIWQPVMWLGTTAILMQVFYNLAIMRYALYTGESNFVGFFRTRPGPWFWTAFYLFIDTGGYWPYLAANAAVALSAALLHRLPTAQDDALVRKLGYVIFLASFVPADFRWQDLQRPWNGSWSPSWSWCWALSELRQLCSGSAGTRKWEIFSGLYRFGALPDGEFSCRATLAACAAIAGAGGLSKFSLFPTTRATKDGVMGSQVGAIRQRRRGASTIALWHTGKVLEIGPEKSGSGGKAGCRHILRDQVVLWARACTIGVALPAVISYEYIRGAKHVEGNGCCGHDGTGAGCAARRHSLASHAALRIRDPVPDADHQSR